MRYFYCALSLAISNFLYQWTTTQNWHTAVERSVFQAVAIGCVALWDMRGTK